MKSNKKTSVKKDLVFVEIEALDESKLKNHLFSLDFPMEIPLQNSTEIPSCCEAC